MGSNLAKRGDFEQGSLSGAYPIMRGTHRAGANRYANRFIDHACPISQRFGFRQSTELISPRGNLKVNYYHLGTPELEIASDDFESKYCSRGQQKADMLTYHLRFMLGK